MTRYSPLRPLAALSAGAGVLVGIDPAFGELFRGLRSPGTWIASAGADAAAEQLARAVIWCLVAWLAAGLLAAVLTQLPGGFGVLCSRLSTAMLPGMLRRLLGVGVGLGVALTPIAGPSVASAAPAPAVSNAQRQVLPAPAGPHHAVSTLGAAPAMPSTRTMPENRTRVVRPHESLWTIARERHPDATDAEISLLWPAWYESNRAAIGPDPNYLRPGQHLLTPASDQSEDHR